MTGIWAVAFGVQWFILFLLVILMAGVLRYLGTLPSQIENERIRATRFKQGNPVSDFTLPDLQGRLVPASSLFGHNRQMWFYVSTTCSPCKNLVRQMVELAQREEGLHSIGWSFVFICPAEAEHAEEMLHDLPMDDVTVLLDGSGLMRKEFGIHSVPVIIALDSSGRILDQSLSPTSEWLYRTLQVPAPEQTAGDNSYQAHESALKR